MALLCCDGVRFGKPCRTLFAVGLMRCPHCRGGIHHEFGSRPEDEEHPQMPKIRRNYGPDAVTETDSEPGSDVTEPAAPDVVSRPAVNQAKGDWVTYVAALYDRLGEPLTDPATFGADYTKAQLIEMATRLDSQPDDDIAPDDGGDEDDEPAESAPSDDDE